jgi:hypothetical protein
MSNRVILDRSPCPYQIVASVIGGLLLALLRPPVSQAQPGPPAPAIIVLVRTLAGAPVAGVQLTLRPATPALGGPPDAPALRQATTDAQGRATFPPLDGWIWYLTLHGTVAGRPIEDPASQGKPPWGTNPAGDGFPIVADPPLEDTAAIPTAAAGTPPALVPIVLVDRPDRWIAGLDLGSATSAPVSLPAAGQAAPGPPATPARPLTSRPSGTGDPGPAPLPVALVGVAGLVLAGTLAFYRRRHPNAERGTRNAAGSHPDPPRPPAHFRHRPAGGPHA